MSLNSTPQAQRVYIGFFGRTNVGKSSLINVFSGQDISIVSEIEGTTTDPVKKTMELLPLGPVLLIDTPGLGDDGELGKERIKRTMRILEQTDIAIIVFDAEKGIGDIENDFIEKCKKRNIPYVIVANKIDLLSDGNIYTYKNNVNPVSTKNGNGIEKLKETVARLFTMQEKKKPVIRDLVNPGDIVVLVIPIDSSAPKGRIIMPQQMVIRDLLDGGMIPVCCRHTELLDTLKSLAKKPALVITDSQVFSYVNNLVPSDVKLTSFSIVMSRFKGTYEQSLKGVEILDKITSESKILISEGCTHHRQCEDIGTVKLPKWIREYTKSSPKFYFTGGGEFPENLSNYDLIIHCGGCMLNEKEVKYRYNISKQQGVPITNYGMAISKITGVRKRMLL